MESHSFMQNMQFKSHFGTVKGLVVSVKGFQRLFGTIFLHDKDKTTFSIESINSFLNEIQTRDEKRQSKHTCTNDIPGQNNFT